VAAGVPFVLGLIDDVVDEFPIQVLAAGWDLAAFTAAVVVITCLLVSLAPALQITRIAWRGAGGTSSAPTSRVRGVLLAVQIAIATVLLLSATLVARGVSHATSVQADFALQTTTLVELWDPPDRPRASRMADMASRN
jgi:hypothetical protein